MFRITFYIKSMGHETRNTEHGTRNKKYDLSLGFVLLFLFFTLFDFIPERTDRAAQSLAARDRSKFASASFTNSSLTGSMVSFLCRTHDNAAA